MKNLFLTLFAFFALNATAQKEFLGTWQSEDSKYIMIISEFNNEFKIINYYSEKKLNVDGNPRFEIEYVDEKIIHHKKGALYTIVNNISTNWEINVIYTLKNKNKISAYFFNSEYEETVNYKKNKN